MRNDLHNYTSSQQSPRMWCSQTRKYKQSLYGSMFLEDFCHHFSSKLAPIGDHDRFYDVSPHDDHLKRLLLFCGVRIRGWRHLCGQSLCIVGWVCVHGRGRAEAADAGGALLGYEADW